MSTDLTCFLFGIPATFIWAIGVRKGVMMGRPTHWVRRYDDPLTYWLVTTFYGSAAVGLLVAPILHWTGLRA
jgi:hypothetical protein